MRNRASIVDIFKVHKRSKKHQCPPAKLVLPILFSTAVVFGAIVMPQTAEAATSAAIASSQKTAVDSGTNPSSSLKDNPTGKVDQSTGKASLAIANVQTDPNAKVTQNNAGYVMENGKFRVQIGTSGEIDGLYIKDDAFNTNYVMNPTDNPKQNNSAHEWMGELMFRTKKGDANSTMPWDKEYTSQTPASVRSLSLKDNTVVVTYDPASNKNGNNNGIKNMEVVETYTLDNDGHLHWGIDVKNTTNSTLTIGDFGLPMPFREYWHYSPAKGQSQLDSAYENSVVFHSFVGQDSSYIYANRPSGIGNFLTFTPDSSTDSKLEYQDHWEVNDGKSLTSAEKAWAMQPFGANVAGTTGWDNGLNVYYVNSEAIAPTGNRGYLPSTGTVLNAGESKHFAFNFSTADIKNTASNSATNSSASSASSSADSSATSGDMTDTKYENQLKSILYNEGLVDAVSVPSMVLTKNADGVAHGQMYLHTKVPQNQISLSFQNQHDDQVSKQNNPKENKLDASGVSNNLGKATYKKTVQKDGQNYYVYDIEFTSNGRNNIIVNYQLNGQNKKTTLQYDVIDNPEKSLEKHAQFILKTQINNSGQFNDKIFDDWSMDKKATVGDFTTAYAGWGDDWGLTHGLFLADMNTKIANKDQVQALDNYLYTGVWNSLMKGHHSDYGVADWLVPTQNSYTWRSYSYVHIYNTYYEMYKIAKANPDLIKYNVTNYPVYQADPAKYKKDPAAVYLAMAYNILKACYTNDGIRYKDDGLMGESTTPEIIKALKSENMTDQAANVQNWMKAKYQVYANQKYPFGSEMNYDNTGEESVYMLGDMYNNRSLMSKVDMKTRADRGVQPLWYQYGVPVTIDGENWWQFQYTTSLADIGMNNWLVSQNNGLSQDQMGMAERANYAAKLGNLTQINTGQIDSDAANNGAVSWTYQAELGNFAQPNEYSYAKTGAGMLHNGWRQTSGEGDLALFGALQVLSADVANDPIFGLVGYGAEVVDKGDNYDITPEDGLRQKLNLVNEQTAYAFTADRYTHAVVKKDNSSTTFVVENTAGKAHDLQLSITNPKYDSKTYDVLWNGKKMTSVKEDQKVTDITVPIGAENGTLQIVKQSDTPTPSPVPDNQSSSSSSSESASSSATSSSSSDSDSNNEPANHVSTVKKPTLKKGTAIYAIKKVSLYKHATFKHNQRVATYKKHKRINRPMFVVTGYAYSNNGVLRYKVKDVNHGSKTYGKRGYMTAKKQYIQPVYYKTVPQSKMVTIIAKHGVNAYNKMNQKGFVKHYQHGTHLKVKKIVKYHLTTRYQLSNGHYITANKKFVIQGKD